MKRLFTVLMLVLMMSLSTGPVVLASHGEPIRGCPKPFGEPHHAHPHDIHHEGHIGTHTDRNRDGYICVKHLPGDKHLHIDNNVPFK